IEAEMEHNAGSIISRPNAVRLSGVPLAPASTITTEKSNDPSNANMMAYKLKFGNLALMNALHRGTKKASNIRIACAPKTYAVKPRPNLCSKK
ncbi:MAG: hypothetical protein AAGA22_03865, partial [Pseudomonadota bacterium]